MTSDKPLFTPGPLTTSSSVKRAMLRDLGSRDAQFIETVRDIRSSLLRIAGVSCEEGYEAVLLQGSGTYAIEAVISSVSPPDSKLLVVVNGAYGNRIATIADVRGIPCTVLKFRENELPVLDDIEGALVADPSITAVAVVHCETTSGIMNPIQKIGEMVNRHGKRYIVDSMSAFGAVTFDIRSCHIDHLISSANKCIEGVPGFAFVICRREALVALQGAAHSLTLDLYAQWEGLESNGQFRFTPPTHTILAFQQALNELDDEGGVAGRGSRYRTNYEVLVKGMRQLGFEEYVPAKLQGFIITSFRYPDHANFQFQRFYDLLNGRGFVIYPGKVTDADCFRIGSIGRLFPKDFQDLLSAIADVLTEMEVDLRRRESNAKS